MPAARFSAISSSRSAGVMRSGWRGFATAVISGEDGRKVTLIIYSEEERSVGVAPFAIIVLFTDA
jgi:hypothetical protein